MRQSIPFVISSDVRSVTREESESRVGTRDEAAELAGSALRRSRQAAEALLAMQAPDGSWCGDLLGDSTLLSDYILLQLWMFPPDGDGAWRHPDPIRIERVLHSIWRHERPEGGWNLFPGGPAEINATVRAYTALKLAGMCRRGSGAFGSPGPDGPDASFQARRELQAGLDRVCGLIQGMGGLQACNSYTKINLSLFGLFPRRFVPTVPPEILLVPGSVLYEMSSWTRTIIVPLAIVQALGRTCPTPHGMTVNELLKPNKRLSLPKRDRISELFVQADRLFKLWQQRGPQKIRSKAIRSAERWMLEHMQYAEGLGAIYPAMMYAIMAMDALGYERDQPDLVLAMKQFEDLLLDNGDLLVFQPAKSPVWDTAIAAFALGELLAVAPDPAAARQLTRAADWLLEKEVRRKGDWSEKRPDLTPSGWAFEFANEFYPDIDDTAMVLLTLLHAQASDPERQAKTERRATEWLLGMQSSDGGWAAFDVDNNWEILNRVPFADHNAMLDPTCADITGRVLESLCRRGMTFRDEPIRRGVHYLLATQEGDGRWYGRWGVNYIYGTFLALRGLQASGDPAAGRAMRGAVGWLKSVQAEDGGWGESCLGYEENRYVPAPSTPSQTAWALLGLIAAEGPGSAAVRRGVEWLHDHQRMDGTWHEELHTGTGFPNVFYLSYGLYRNYFPLLALATYAKRTEQKAPSAALVMQLAGAVGSLAG